MKKKELLEEFFALGQKLGVKVMKGKGSFSGGTCKVNEERVVVINQMKPIEQRLNILAKSFSSFDLSEIYIVPALRDFIDEANGLEF